MSKGTEVDKQESKGEAAYDPRNRKFYIHELMLQ